jgi:hypothetical protein
MANPTPYRTLPAARRVALLTRAIKESREVRALMVQRMVKRGGGFRAVTLQGWAPDKLAKEVVRMNAESADDELTLLNLLYVEFEPEIQACFLDAAGVKHEGGHIPEDAVPPFTDAAGTARGVEAVIAMYGDDGRHYLQTIARYNGEAWPGLAIS